MLTIEQVENIRNNPQLVLLCVLIVKLYKIYWRCENG